MWKKPTLRPLIPIFDDLEQTHVPWKECGRKQMQSRLNSNTNLGKAVSTQTRYQYGI